MQLKPILPVIVLFTQTLSFVAAFNSFNLLPVVHERNEKRLVSILPGNDLRSTCHSGAKKLNYEHSIKSKKDDTDEMIPKDKTSSSGTNNSVEDKDTSKRSRFRLSQFSSLNQLNSGPNLFYLPPIQIEDISVVLFDVFLLTNLSVGISFFVCHRMSLQYISPAVSEGVLLSILWVISGLYYGTFLGSAINGHSDMDQIEQTPKGGPIAAGILALSTFVTTSSLRIIVALAAAFIEHRPVGVAPGEELIPLEIGFGLVLMSRWRYIWSESKQY